MQWCPGLLTCRVYSKTGFLDSQILLHTTLDWAHAPDRLTACTTNRLLPGLPPVCAGNARTDRPEKLHWLLGAHSMLHDLLLWAASMFIAPITGTRQLPYTSHQVRQSMTAKKDLKRCQTMAHGMVSQLAVARAAALYTADQ